MRIKYYEVKLYIGSKEGYHGKQFNKSDLMKVVSEYQGNFPRENMVSLRYTDCTFQVGDWSEDGWEIAAINYPRFIKDESFLEDYFEGLANYLLHKMKQNRITVCTPELSTTYEREDAEYR